MFVLSIKEMPSQGCIIKHELDRDQSSVEYEDRVFYDEQFLQFGNTIWKRLPVMVG